MSPIQRRFALGLLATLPFSFAVPLAAQDSPSKDDLFHDQVSETFRTNIVVLSVPGWLEEVGIVRQILNDLKAHLKFLEGNYLSFNVDNLITAGFDAAAIRLYAEAIAKSPVATAKQKRDAADLAERARILEEKIKDRLKEKFGIDDVNAYKSQVREFDKIISPIIGDDPRTR